MRKVDYVSKRIYNQIEMYSRSVGTSSCTKSIASNDIKKRYLKKAHETPILTYR